MSISILHLSDISDIHAGPGELIDEDNKVRVPGSELRRQLARLGAYLSALPKVPDFVVVSPTEWDNFILDGQSPSKLMTSVLKA